MRLGRRMWRTIARACGARSLGDWVRSAELARDEQRVADAARLFDRALRIVPNNVGLLIMSGHMHKEAGDPVTAERRYRAALLLRPEDADLAVQLGHLYKRMARFTEAEHWYGRAGTLSPEWDEPARELATVARLRNGSVLPGVGDDDAADLPLTLLPGAIDPVTPAVPGLTLKRMGREEDTRWGRRRTLRGISAIHGFLVTPARIAFLRVTFDGAVIATIVPRAVPLAGQAEGGDLRKYVFNLWLDFSRRPIGIHLLELCFVEPDGAVHPFAEEVVVALPLSEADYPGSDALVDTDGGKPDALEARIRARPSMVRSAARPLFPDGVRRVLVMRTDQLGDVVASVPALRRLRQIVPRAQLVGLVTSANVDIARSLGLFDELITVDFPDDPVERRRIMPLAAQQALRARLHTYRFDIAIDLAASNLSRELLKLSGARYLHGSGGGDWPWLSGKEEFSTRDRWTGLDIVPHSAKILALVEALGAALDTGMPVIRRDDLARERLAAYGIGPDARFILLHAGARIVFSRWPGFGELARMLLKRTRLHVVMMADDPAILAALPKRLTASKRFLLLREQVPFDDFDAFISFADVVVGNDSGPKHLAALRGTPVVTLFTARINWAEWGQENVGTIISRRVPCAGCTIFHDADECGKDFACIRDIQAREVFDAVAAQLLQSNTNLPR
jgi:ADP-heptose:LPS heptosyltransferase